MGSLTSSDDQPIPPAKPQPQVSTGVSSPTDKTCTQWTVLETQTEETPNHIVNYTMTAPLSVSCNVLHLVFTHSKHWVCSTSLVLLVPVGVCAEQPLHAAHNIEQIRQRPTRWLSETPRETPTHGLYKSLPLRSRFHAWVDWRKIVQRIGRTIQNLVVWFLLDLLHIWGFP